MERKSSFLSDGTFESISESETSTAPSSLQTIIRAPYVISNNNQYNPHQNLTEHESHPSSPNVNIKSSESESEMLTSANNLRYNMMKLITLSAEFDP